MNNSQIAIDKVSLSLDEPVDKTEELREMESRLVRIIEAINRIKDLEDWSTLKTLIFSQRIESLEGKLLTESLKNDLNDSEIYRLQGRLFEAKKYDLDKLLESNRDELSKVRNIIKLTQPTER